jgi:CHAT domain-containing protein
MEELEYAEDEVEYTRQIAETASVGPVCCLTGKDVTKKRVIPALERAWLAHLAMHGQYVPNTPRQSKLILAREEDTNEEPTSTTREESAYTITLEECLNGQINLGNMRLLVLSACETSIIDIVQASDETISLATGFLQAGAAGVIASLWPVDDEATYLLMSRFMQLYLNPQPKQRSPAWCLAEAQRWLREEATNEILSTYNPAKDVSRTHLRLRAMGLSKIRSISLTRGKTLEISRFMADAEKDIAPDILPYKDPYYWAGFVVTGC